MRVNPVLRNESKIAVRSIKFTLMIFAYIAALSIAVMIYYTSLNSRIFSSGLDLESSVIFYVVMAIGQALLLLFIVPALSSTAICSEREKQTLDILLSSKLTPLQIILGKVSASSLRVIVLIISTMPLYAIGALIGGVKLTNIWISFTYLYRNYCYYLGNTYCDCLPNEYEWKLYIYST